jgi:predicted AAA+ superfamily ATPase
VIAESGVMAAFPQRTAADFYLWVMDHRHYLVTQGQADLVEPGRAAEEFVQHYQTGKIPPAVEGPTP